jgi:type IV pilus assembly protein PilW
VTAISAGLPPHTITLQDDTGIAVNANISCLGTWSAVTYAVDGGNLQLNGNDSVAGIVNIQAQYGIANSANSNRITAWVEPTGATWAAPSVANRNRIKAIRVAIVARNSKLELGNVTAECDPVVEVGGAIETASPAPEIDLSDDADWRRYRYRVFETIIPLRNMIWSKDTL